jgi:hypothetical protein
MAADSLTLNGCFPKLTLKSASQASRIGQKWMFYAHLTFLENIQVCKSAHCPLTQVKTNNQYHA